jgi:hypothetical protein
MYELNIKSNSLKETKRDLVYYEKMIGKALSIEKNSCCKSSYQKQLTKILGLIIELNNR